MGMFDGIHDFGKVIGRLVDGRGEPQGPTPPSPAGTLGRLGTAIKGAAGSEILDAGQLLIAGMRLTTGWGDPEQGEPFGHGSARFTRAGETVASAYPREDWQGGGADAYSVANCRQASRTAGMAVLDRSVQTVIAREAYQVAHHRDTLDDQSNYLGDLSYATWAIALIPGVGKAMKAAVELAAVSSALNICTFELYSLSQEAGENATELQELAGEYSALTQKKAAPPDFDDEPPPSPSDDRPMPVPPDQQAPHSSPTTESAGVAPISSPGAPSPGSSAAATPSPETASGPATALPDVATEVPGDVPVPQALPGASSAMPTDAMAGMISAFGAVGGIIGSVVAPLAAVLTGVAGAAGQSLSTLASAGGADTKTGDAPADEDIEPTRDPEAEAEAEDEPTDDAATGAAGAGAGPVPAEVVRESDGSPQPPPADDFEAPPPAATRPPQ